MDSTYSSFSNPSSCESTSLIANNSITTAKEQKKLKNKGGGKLSTDPQSVAARQRRHRISDRFKILQSLVPGGSKMDTVSMLEEAIQYVKFLKNQIRLHQSMISTLVHDNADHRHDPAATTFTYNYNDNNCSSFDHYNNHSSSSWDQMLRGGEMISTDDQLGSMPWFHCDEDGPNFDAPMPGEFND